MDTFDRDLAVGKKIEEDVLRMIRKKYDCAYIVDGYFKEYDIWIPELNIGVEVKSDKKSKFTGNIVIEIEFNEKPSALSTTTAKFWVIHDGDKYVWFEVEKIKECIKNHNLTPARFIGKGDKHYKLAYLIKKEILYNYSYGKRSKHFA